jgi:5'-nucleotidase
MSLAVLSTISALNALALVLVGCGGATTTPGPPEPRHHGASSESRAVSTRTVISIVGTSDVHGHVESLAWFAGYLENLRAARAADGGGVLLVDAGDIFQGTLESNLGEGDVMVEAFEALGYHAAAIGNHEFDFGPVGEAATPESPNDDPRGALKARTAQASFPFLLANVVTEDGRAIEWPNVKPSTLVDVAGVSIGLVGVTTVSTPHTTIAANFAGLVVTPLGEAFAREARALRAQGARVIVALAHAGLACEAFDAPEDPSSCDLAEELAVVLRDLPRGTVDVVLGGHTHRAVSHRIHGVPVIQAPPYGRGFTRIDLTYDDATHAVVDVRFFAPQAICPEREDGGLECRPDPYEAAPVEMSSAVQAVVEPAVARALDQRHRPVGAELTATVTRSYMQESALGNLFADLMLSGIPGADVALMNGGGLRADLPAGELRYGALFEAMPFDNRVATVRLTAADLRDVLARNIAGDDGILALGGIRATVACNGGNLDVRLRRENGRPLPPSAELLVVTSDFLATGGSGVFTAEQQSADRVVISDRLLRDLLAERLAAHRGAIDPSRLHNPARPRLVYEGERPVSCGAP